MLSVLFIEDDRASIEEILRRIRQERTDIESRVHDFEGAEEVIRSFRPDIVVLDLWQGIVDGDNQGAEKLDFIWNRRFCPVIVHSAQPDISEEHRNEFVREITKGQDSPRAVLDAIDELRPHVEVLREAEEHIRDSFSIAMRDVAPSVFDVFTDPDRRKDSIIRAGRRRLAALMDAVPGDGAILASWEQYVFPPISSNVFLGDILREADGDPGEPAVFRVVLTPSCDLVSGDGRDPKVNEVLVAKCLSMRDGLDRTVLKGAKPVRLKERVISTVLSPGHFESIIPFPALQGHIPTMAANLRDLELIPLDDIGIKDGRYRRVGSLDSPFRELVSWAYMRVSGRPGLPDRDLESWRDEIIRVL